MTFARFHECTLNLIQAWLNFIVISGRANQKSLLERLVIPYASRTDQTLRRHAAACAQVLRSKDTTGGGWRPVRDAYIHAAIVASFSITPGQRQTDTVRYDDLNGGTFQLCKEDWSNR
jgi:hypothetical protein